MTTQRTIIDPQLLPCYLTEQEAAALCRRTSRTIREWVKAGRLQCGVHWVCPGGARRLYLRDRLIAWIEQQVNHWEAIPEPTEKRGRSGFNLTRSPALAEMLED
jgi:hypothetical protein